MLGDIETSSSRSNVVISRIIDYPFTRRKDHRLSLPRVQMCCLTSHTKPISVQKSMAVDQTGLILLLSALVPICTDSTTITHIGYEYVKALVSTAVARNGSADVRR
jgi:hypothetical protein